MVSYFYDPTTEQFYDTSAKLYESLIYRPHQDKDEILPGSTGGAIYRLLNLAHFSKRPPWSMLAEFK